MNRVTIGVLVAVAAGSAILSSGIPGWGRATDARLREVAPGAAMRDGRATPLPGEGKAIRP